MATHKNSVLVVEDEEATRALITTYFRNEGFLVTACEDGMSARLEISAREFDVVLMDVNLPDDDGFEVLREVRANYPSTPVIMVTSRSTEIDTVLGLELGADDYVAKPFSLPELRARVRTVLRRANERTGSQESTGPVRLGRWLVDLTRREITQDDGSMIRVTRGEFDLLSALLKYRGAPVSRDFLLDVVSANSADTSDRTVDTLVSRIRSKLREYSNDTLIIETVRGIGYRLIDVTRSQEKGG